MSVYRSLTDWVDSVEKRNRKAGYRALNKSAAKAKTQFRKEVQSSTGLKAKDVNRRLYVRKANIEKLSAHVSLGTKIGIPLRMFKPKEKIVRVGRGRTARRYKGVTVKIPAAGGRYTVPGGFIINSSRGKSLATALIVKRKTGAKYPMAELRYNISPAAQAKQAELVEFMRKDFKVQFKAQLKVVK